MSGTYNGGFRPRIGDTIKTSRGTRVVLSHPLQVYLRDVSWYACGRGGSAGRYHFEGKDLASACGKARIIDIDHPHDATLVPVVLRCRARGCRERWPTP